MYVCTFVRIVVVRTSTACRRNVSISTHCQETATTDNVLTASVGLFVPLIAKDSQDQAVADFLLAGRQIVDGEPLTLQWYAFKYTHSLKTGSAVTSPTYAIFDTFAGEEGRNAHLTGG